MAQWWEEWELRILVLASLGAQFSLVVFIAVRKFRISPLLSFSFRMAQIGSDALAIFALATLFDRQKSGPLGSYARGASRDLELELFWAPVLLMHLGGQIIITTYKIEDNERSTQYILTSLSKVTAALYVFYKTWSSNDKRLLATTILLFMLVINRCFQKFLNLKETSFNALWKASEVSVTEIGGDEQLDKFILAAMHIYRTNMQLPTLQTVAIPILPFQLFLDFPCSCFDRLEMLMHFCSLERESALKAIEEPLLRMTKFLYTKGNQRYTSLPSISGLILFVSTILLAVATICAALILVSSRIPLIIISPSKKTAIHLVPSHVSMDVYITCGLWGGTVVVELIYTLVEQYIPGKFSGRILQHSLIGLFAHNGRHSTLRRIAGWLQCKDFMDGLWRVEPGDGDSCEEITELVRCHVRTGWTECITNAYYYRLFNDTRGELTLMKNRCLQELGWSTRRAFDESVVLWHLATDICFHHTDHTSSDDSVSARQCKVMSNYMVHLLSDNPEMLMPGSRKRLLAMAYEELEVLLEGEVTPRDEKELTRRVVQKCELASHSSQQEMAASLIGDALKLAQSLLSVDETKIWELIQGVWVEMLCFSASRCRGYLHAEALGKGGEFLSYVWVLLARTGMETFPEKLQRRERSSFGSYEYLGFGFPREGGDVVTPLAVAPTGVQIFPEELQRSEGHSLQSEEPLNLGLARESGDAVAPSARTGVDIFPEDLQSSEGHSFDSHESIDLGLAPESGDAVTPLAARSEGTVDIILEP